MTTSEQLQPIQWMINHYTDLANTVWETYPNLDEAYLMYDHYMVYVLMYERARDRVFNSPN